MRGIPARPQAGAPDAGLPARGRPPARAPRAAPGPPAAVELLSRGLEERRPGAEVALPALLDLLLVLILRAWLDEHGGDADTAGWPAALTDPPVAAALQRMHREPAHPWTAQSLGVVAGLSRTAFARRFTALEFGIAPGRYRRTARTAAGSEDEAEDPVAAFPTGPGQEQVPARVLDPAH